MKINPFFNYLNAKSDVHYLLFTMLPRGHGNLTKPRSRYETRIHGLGGAYAFLLELRAIRHFDDFFG